jgi:serine/threonine protein kinase
MSEVWRARDTVLDRDVAVKVLDGETALLRRMAIRTEALAAAKLAHAHVARVFDYGESEEGGRLVPFVVMELLEGTRCPGPPCRCRPRWRSRSAPRWRRRWRRPTPRAWCTATSSRAT